MQLIVRKVYWLKVCLAVFYIFLPPLVDRVRLYHISAVSYFPTSYTHSSLFILFFLSPLFCLGACCCLASGVWTQPNPLSYYPPHDLSYNSGGSTSSIQSLWICGEDCHISKVSWLDFPALSLSFTTHTCTWYTFSDSLTDWMWMVRWIYQLIWALYMWVNWAVLFQKVSHKQHL